MKPISSLHLFVVVVVSLLVLERVDGHGYLYDPPGRSSMWRVGFTNVTKNVNDNALFCGGMGVQYNNINQGRCGECGDEWSLPRPRPNDEGGIYGRGVIGQNYIAGNVVRMTAVLTANHKGYFEVRLCKKSSASELVTQACLDQNVLQLVDGSGTRFSPGSSVGNIDMLYRLPAGLTCNYCVIQWRYVAGNNWGVCDDGTSGLGCGSQETYHNCADVSIQ